MKTENLDWLQFGFNLASIFSAKLKCSCPTHYQTW